MADMQARRRWARERALRMANSVAWPSLRVRADLMWRRQKKKPTSPTGCAGEPSTRDASPSFSRWILDLNTGVYHRAKKSLVTAYGACTAAHSCLWVGTHMLR